MGCLKQRVKLPVRSSRIQLESGEGGGGGGGGGGVGAATKVGFCQKHTPPARTGIRLHSGAS